MGLYGGVLILYVWPRFLGGHALLWCLCAVLGVVFGAVSVGRVFAASRGKGSFCSKRG